MNIQRIGKLKPTKVMKEVIFITTPRIGFIPQLKMQGPVVTPTPVTREIAKSMIVAGIKTYQIDPKTRRATLLTLENVFRGEGFRKPKDEDDNKKENHEDKNKGGEKKPEVPTSGVAPQNPVTPVTFSGVQTPAKEEEKKEEPKKENTEEKTDKKNGSTEKKDKNK